MGEESIHMTPEYLTNGIRKWQSLSIENLISANQDETPLFQSSPIHGMLFSFQFSISYCLVLSNFVKMFSVECALFNVQIIRIVSTLQKGKGI